MGAAQYGIDQIPVERHTLIAQFYILSPGNHGLLYRQPVDPSDIVGREIPDAHAAIRVYGQFEMLAAHAHRHNCSSDSDCRCGIGHKGQTVGLCVTAYGYFHTTLNSFNFKTYGLLISVGDLQNNLIKLSKVK